MHHHAPQAPESNAPTEPAYTPSGNSPTWVAFALISGSYFAALIGLAAYCLVLP